MSTRENGWYYGKRIHKFCRMHGIETELWLNLRPKTQQIQSINHNPHKITVLWYPFSVGQWHKTKFVGAEVHLKQPFWKLLPDWKEHFVIYLRYIIKNFAFYPFFFTTNSICRSYILRETIVNQGSSIYFVIYTMKKVFYFIIFYHCRSLVWEVPKRVLYCILFH